MSKLAKAREEFGFRNVWTVDGRIRYIGEGSQFPKTYYNYNVFNVVMVVLRKISSYGCSFVLLKCLFFYAGFF